MTSIHLQLVLLLVISHYWVYKWQLSLELSDTKPVCYKTGIKEIQAFTLVILKKRENLLFKSTEEILTGLEFGMKSLTDLNRRTSRLEYNNNRIII